MSILPPICASMQTPTHHVEVSQLFSSIITYMNTHSYPSIHTKTCVHTIILGAQKDCASSNV